MADFWEIFKDLDTNNILQIILVGVFLIIVFASCVQSFFASSIEILFLNKADVLKGESLAYILLFATLGLANYITIFNEYLVAIYIIILIGAILLLVGLFILSKIKKLNKRRVFFFKYKEHIRLCVIMCFFPLATVQISSLKNVNFECCVIISALIEIMVIVLCYMNPGKRNSKIVLQVGHQKWYVLRRVDNYLMCGDEKDVDSSKKIKLIDIDTIVKDDYCFEKDEIH